MILVVTAKPGCKRVGVERLPDGLYRVAVREKAQDGRANEAIMKLLAKHFGVPQSSVILLQGAKGRLKRFQILDK